ncbi:MAG TPA: hypothetical protein ENN38_04595 [Actinobacteria bacterium]|nr:hypothetical protein [Actinomycetota bacterium]
MVKMIKENIFSKKFLLFLALLLVGFFVFFIVLGSFKRALVSSVFLLLFFLSLKWTEFALALLIVLVPLVSGRFIFEILPFDAVTVTVAISIISLLFSCFKKERSVFPPTKLDVSVLLFLIVSLMTVFWAYSPPKALATWLRYFGYLILIFVVAYRVRYKRTIEILLSLFVLSATMSCFIGFNQFLTRPGMSIGMQGLSQEIVARMAGTYINPNFFGEFLVLAIPIGLALTLALNSTRHRIFCGACTAILLFSLVLTYTRGSWLGLAVGLVIFALIVEKRLLWFGVLLSPLVFKLPGVASRIVSMFDISGGTVACRLRLWNVVFKIISENFLFGIGIGNYLTAFTHYVFKYPELSVGYVQYGAHNSYLTLLAEVGIFGLLAFLGVIVVIFKLGYCFTRRVKNDKFSVYIMGGILASLSAFLVNGFTSNSLLHPRAAVFFWFLAGIALVLIYNYENIGKIKTRQNFLKLYNGSYFYGILTGVKSSFLSAYENHWLKRSFDFVGRANLLKFSKILGSVDASLKSSVDLKESSKTLGVFCKFRDNLLGWIDNSYFRAAIKKIL